MPRYQIGESLLPSTVHGICRLLDVHDKVAGAGFVRKNGAALRWGTSKDIWTFGFGQAPLLAQVGANYAFQVERARFDEILLDNARSHGVDVREGHHARSLVLDDARVVGVDYTDSNRAPGSARGRFVIDASGHRSPLRSHAGRREHSQFFRNVALFGYFEQAGRMPAPNAGNILCEAFEDGWIWLIPLSQGPRFLTSVGLVAGKASAKHFGSDPEGSFAAGIERCPNVRSLLAGAQRVMSGRYAGLRTRRDWTYTNERLCIPGLFLVGDSACFLDPVLSTGVHLATYSALLAARSVNSILPGVISEDAAMSEFERRYRVEFEVYLNFLLAFYDMHADADSYYWSARKVLGTREPDRAAFVRLVAGAATSPELYFHRKAGLGRILQSFADEVGLDAHMDLRSEASQALARRLGRLMGDAAGDAARPGSDDLRRVSWGKNLDRVPASMPTRGMIVADEDGLGWKVA